MRVFRLRKTNGEEEQIRADECEWDTRDGFIKFKSGQNIVAFFRGEDVASVLDLVAEADEDDVQNYLQG